MATTALGAAGFLRFGVNAGIHVTGTRSAARGLTSARPRPSTARFSPPRSATARFSPPRSAAVRFTGTSSAAVRFTGTSSAAVRFTGTCSATAHFASLHPAGGTTRPRLLLLRCATDAPPPPPPADQLPASRDTPPPPPSNTSRLMRFWYALKPLAYSIAILVVAFGVGVMACKDEASVSWAAYIVRLCEKAEKVHKVLMHILPLVVALVKSFW